jgi:hypothetical protein
MNKHTMTTKIPGGVRGGTGRGANLGLRAIILACVWGGGLC